MPSVEQKATYFRTPFAGDQTVAVVVLMQTYKEWTYRRSPVQYIEQIDHTNSQLHRPSASADSAIWGDTAVVLQP